MESMIGRIPEKRGYDQPFKGTLHLTKIIIIMFFILILQLGSRDSSLKTYFWVFKYPQKMWYYF